MVNFKLLTLALALVSGSAFAGYAQLAPPPGWSQGGSAASTFNFSKIAANDAVFTANTVRTTASLNVGGKLVKVPAVMRLAANAPRIAAAALYLNPALRVGVAIASWLALTSFFWDESQQKWMENTDSVNPYPTVFYPIAQDPGIKYTEPNAACGRRLAVLGLPGGSFSSYGLSDGVLNCHFTYNLPFPPFTKGVPYDSPVEAVKGPCPPGSVDTGSGCKAGGKPVPVTQPQFEEGLYPKPMPETVPSELPKTVEWPVEKPIINPSPEPSPQPQPLRVPQGDPQPIPGTDPRQYRSPAIDIVPSPTATDPWRVDVQPKDIIKTDPTPLPETAPVPAPTPDTPPDTTAPPTEQTDFCKANPDVLACAKPELDTPDEDQTPSKNKDISISPAGGFGSGGSCPSGKTLKAAGIQLSYQPVCDFMSAMRPVVIALAWLGAGLILLGLRGQTS